MAIKCEHDDFLARVDVVRLSHEEDGPVTGFQADITVWCARCSMKFRFVGLGAGTSHLEPRVSVDGLELRAPIEPAEHAVFHPVARYEMPPRTTN